MLFFLAEFMNTITMSAIIVTLFLGGPSGPGLDVLPWLWPILWFFAKLLVFLFVYVWFRATLPRLRYDQLMDLGWKVLIPASLGWLLILAALLRRALVPGRRRGRRASLAWVLLARAMRVGRERSDPDVAEVGG